MLQRRFPEAGEEELHKAHAYAYGGALVQDMGYAPFTSRLFSDLTHYVRSGDFVLALLGEAKTLDECAFALGSLAHYAADVEGHVAINRLTAMLYPKRRAKFGPDIAYEDARSQHLKIEFALDVIQVARGNYAPDAYHDFIGFEMNRALLERTFPKVYGMRWEDVVTQEDLAVGTYRFTVGKLIPMMTRVAWNSKRKDIEKLSPSTSRSRAVYRLPRRVYEKEWGKTYSKPGPVATVLSYVFRLIPHVGPFQAFGFRPVSSQGEALFLESFAKSVEHYRKLLHAWDENRLVLADLCLDTGRPTKPGEYRMADEAYRSLLDKLAERDYAEVPPELRMELVRHLDGVTGLPEKTLAQLERLRMGGEWAAARE